MDSMKLKVSTSKLKEVTSDTTARIAKVREAFSEIDDKIIHSVSYWESQGQVCMEEQYRIRKEDYERVFSALEEHTRKLQKMAGIYEKTEKEIKEAANALPDNILS